MNAFKRAEPEEESPPVIYKGQRNLIAACSELKLENNQVERYFSTYLLKGFSFKLRRLFHV